MGVMKLPNLSYMMSVGQLRYIQSVYERAPYRNPDALVRTFLPLLQRWNCHLRGMLVLPRLRADPFYYYVFARTKYYDSVYADAIASGVRHIVNIGCGSDTRAYRFSQAMRQNGVSALECDQAKAIHAKAIIAKRTGSVDHVEYLPIDLNEPGWPDFERWLKRHRGANMLVMMEGVSPYVNAGAFGQFLDLLSAELGTPSRVAYDFKIRGVVDDFGRTNRTTDPFRLASGRDDVAAYHHAHGFRLEQFELSADLTSRLLPGLKGSNVQLFREDGLVVLGLQDGADLKT